MQPQTRVRKMRNPHRPRRHGRSTDGIRQEYYDPDIRAARAAADEAGRPENDTRNEDRS